MLGELIKSNEVQSDLFHVKFFFKSERLMTVFDDINKKMGRGAVMLASEGFKKPWRMKQSNKSHNYTTIWDETISVL